MMSIAPLEISTMKQPVLHEADIWIFLSRHSLGDNTHTLKQTQTDQRIIAIGPGTAETLLSHEFTVDYVPDEHSSIGILNLPILNENRAFNVIIFSEISSPSPLKKALNERGHQAVQFGTYCQKPRCTNTLANEITCIYDQPTYITAHSQRGLQHIVTTIESENLGFIKEKTLVVTHKKMQVYAQKKGFQSVICSADNSAKEVCNTIKQHSIGETHG